MSHGTLQSVRFEVFAFVWIRSTWNETSMKMIRMKESRIIKVNVVRERSATDASWSIQRHTESFLTSKLTVFGGFYRTGFSFKKTKILTEQNFVSKNNHKNKYCEMIIRFETTPI